MIDQAPSRTAFAAASHRAAHQVLDQGRIFADPLALSILGTDDETVSREAQASGHGLRLFIASRTRFAETALQTGADARLVRQLVVLGAGLDTFAYRHPLAKRLRMFEVDHPATQAWKRRRLTLSAIVAPTALTFVPVDFERDSLPLSLEAAGLDPQQRTFFLWLGVVPYLTRDAVFATLAYVAALPGGSEVVFDYANPLDSLPAERRHEHERLAARVAAAGEPFLSYFDTAALHAEMEGLGLTEIEDCGARSLVERYTTARPPSNVQPAGGGAAAEPGGRVIWAATPLG